MALVECPCPCPPGSDCGGFLVIFFFRELALGFICASKSIQAFALFSLGARIETSIKLHWRLCISSSGSGTQEHRTKKEQSH